MRTLSADLLAAQKQPSRTPHVDAIFANTVAGSRRLQRQAFAGSDVTPGVHHGIAQATDGSLTRVRSDGAGAIIRQRITAPTTPSQWNTWATLATGKGNVVAVAARGTRVAIAYTDAAGTGVKMVESTDSGATFGGETAVVTAPAALTHIAIAYKNTSGDLAIAWVSSGATVARLIIRTSGAFGGIQTSPAVAAALTAIAIVYGFDWDLALTGTETTTLKPTLWTYIFGDGNDATAGTWGTTHIQAQADTAANVTFGAPFLAYLDTYYLSYVEIDAFTGGNTRAFLTALHPAASWPTGNYGWPAGRPTAYTASSRGVAIAAASGVAASFGYLWHTAPDRRVGYYAEPQTYDATARVLRADVREHVAGSHGYIDIDNADGALDGIHEETAGPLVALRPGSMLALSWGYRRDGSASPETSRMQDLWITHVEHHRDGGLAFVRFHLGDFWWVLSRARPRGTIQHTSDTYSTILLRAFSRAGLQLTQSAASSRLTTTTPGAFTIPTTEDAATTVRRVLALMADRLRGRAAAAVQVTEPLASASANYDLTAQGHPLARYTIINDPGEAVTWLQALGNAAYGEAIDEDPAIANLGRTEQLRDYNSTTGAAAAATAVAALRQRQMEQPAGEIHLDAPHVGLECLDLVQLTDAAVGVAALKRRIAGIRWDYQRRRGATIFQQTLELAAS